LPEGSLRGDQLTTAFGERAGDDAAVLVRARSLDEAHGDEPVEHLRDRRRGEVGHGGELPRRQVVAGREAEEEVVLREAELPGSLRISAAETTHRAHDALEGLAELRERLVASGLLRLRHGGCHAASEATKGSTGCASGCSARAERSALRRTRHGT